MGEIPWARQGGGQQTNVHALTPLARRQHRMLQLVVGSLSDSTKAAYSLAWEELLASGAQWRQEAWRRVEDVVQFIMDLIEKGLTRVTIAGKLAGIAFWGKLLWGYQPSAGELGRRILEGWTRESAGGGQVRKPLSWRTLSRLVAALPEVCSSRWETCLFSTLMCWMFFGAFRVSELLGGRKGVGVTWEGVRPQGSGILVWLARSKTDQRGRGKWVMLDAPSPQETCPTRWARNWLAMRGSGVPGGIFIHENGSRVTEAQLRGVLRKALQRLGIDGKEYGTHSFRIGAATEATNRGWSQREVMQLGRWSSNCFRRYVRADVDGAQAGTASFGDSL